MGNIAIDNQGISYRPETWPFTNYPSNWYDLDQPSQKLIFEAVTKNIDAQTLKTKAVVKVNKGVTKPRWGNKYYRPDKWPHSMLPDNCDDLTPEDMAIVADRMALKNGCATVAKTFPYELPRFKKNAGCDGYNNQLWHDDPLLWSLDYFPLNWEKLNPNTQNKIAEKMWDTWKKKPPKVKAMPLVIEVTEEKPIDIKTNNVNIRQLSKNINHIKKYYKNFSKADKESIRLLASDLFKTILGEIGIDTPKKRKRRTKAEMEAAAEKVSFGLVDDIPF